MRKDISTDGRHAKIEFSEDWYEDAARRDFTINSIYSDLEGNLYDPFDGKNDLEKVVFNLYPKLFQIKSFMESLPNIQFARMTGSGSAFIAYFVSKNAAINASKILNNKTSKYWNKISKTI